MAKKTVEEVVKLVKSYESLVAQKGSLESRIKVLERHLAIFEDTGNKWILVKANYGNGYDNFADDYIMSDTVKEAIIEDYQRYLEREKNELTDIKIQIDAIKSQLEE